MWYTKKGIARAGLLLGVGTGILVLVGSRSQGDGWGAAVGWGLLCGFGIAGTAALYAWLFSEEDKDSPKV